MLFHLSQYSQLLRTYYIGSWKDKAFFVRHNNIMYHNGRMQHPSIPVKTCPRNRRSSRVKNAREGHTKDSTIAPLTKQRLQSSQTVPAGPIERQNRGALRVVVSQR